MIFTFGSNWVTVFQKSRQSSSMSMTPFASKLKEHFFGGDTLLLSERSELNEKIDTSIKSVQN